MRVQRLRWQVQVATAAKTEYYRDLPLLLEVLAPLLTARALIFKQKGEQNGRTKKILLAEIKA